MFRFIITALILSLCSYILAEDTASLTEAVRFFQKGQIEQAIEKCSAIALSESEDSQEDISKAYVMMAIAYFLQDTPDSKEKCESLIDLLDAVKDPHKNAAIVIIDYLIEGKNEQKMFDALKDVEKDWGSAAYIASFLIAVKSDAEAEKLASLAREYMGSCAGVPLTNWSSAWYVRMKDWNDWIFKGNGDKASLEKLIAEHGMEYRKQKQQAETNEKYSPVSKVLSLYLENKIPEAQKESGIQAKYLISKNDERFAPVIKILKYLGGETSMTVNEIFDITRNDPPLWAISSLSMFAKDLSGNKIPDRNILLQYLDNYKKNFSIGSSTAPEDVAQWSKKVDAWSKWCESGFTPVKGLDPLLLKIKKIDDKKDLTANLASSDKDIRDISLEDFKALKVPYEKRPRPSALTALDEKEVKKYIQTLPEKLRNVEFERFKRISTIKNYIITILERNPYPKGLKAKDGIVSGNVSMANENYIVVRKSSKTMKRVNWNDILVDQYIDFLKYYGGMRLEKFGGTVTKEDSRKAASEDYIQAAVISDWFGNYEDAIEYGKKAIEFCPDSAKTVNILLLK